MPSLSKAAWALLCVWLWATAGVAQAQSSHTLNLGGRASGMGTAYTGIANDGTAAFYNPGGLAYAERLRVTANVTLNSFERVRIDDFLRSSSGSRDLREKSDPSIPIFTSISRSFGGGKRGGPAPFTAAFSAFMLSREQISGEVRSFDGAGRAQTLLYDRSQQTPYYGGSFAYRAPRGFGFGVSAFFTPRRITHQEMTVVPYGGEGSVDSPYFEGASLISRNSRLVIKSYDLVLRLGVIKRIDRRWSVGLTGQLPGIRVKRSTDLRFQLSDVDGSASPTAATFVFVDESFPSSVPIPWELRGGVAYSPTWRVTLSLDLQWVGKAADREAVRVPSIEGLDDRIPPTGVFFDIRGKRDMVANVFLGADVEVRPDIFIRTGFLTDFDADPRVAAEPTQYHSTHIDRYGFTVNFAMNHKERWLQVGLAALLGRGHATGIDIDRAIEGETPFYRTTARSRLFLLSVTAANDFGKVAQETWEDLRKKRSKDGEEE